MNIFLPCPFTFLWLFCILLQSKKSIDFCSLLMKHRKTSREQGTMDGNCFDDNISGAMWS
jgi:hypothetical protein